MGEFDLLQIILMAVVVLSISVSTYIFLIKTVNNKTTANELLHYINDIIAILNRAKRIVKMHNDELPEIEYKKEVIKFATKEVREMLMNSGKFNNNIFESSLDENSIEDFVTFVFNIYMDKNEVREEIDNYMAKEKENNANVDKKDVPQKEDGKVDISSELDL